MALSLAATVVLNDTCTAFTFTDTTGAYSLTNTGGYGSPNIASSAIITSTISVYLPKSTIPYVFTFTVSTGTITAATKTDPDGTITDILSDVSALAFPFDNSTSNVFSIVNTYFGLDADADLSDGVYTTVYEVADVVPNTYNTTVYTLVSRAACCCKQNLYLNLTDRGCGDNKIEVAQTVDAYIKSAIYAANLGMADEAQEFIDKANEICGRNCVNCN